LEETARAGNASCRSSRIKNGLWFCHSLFLLQHSLLLNAPMFANVSFAAKPINLPGNLEYVLSSKVLGGLALQFILFLTGFACFVLIINGLV
jgi:hypothetical protein